MSDIDKEAPTDAGTPIGLTVQVLDGAGILERTAHGWLLCLADAEAGTLERDVFEDPGPGAAGASLATAIEAFLEATFQKKQVANLLTEVGEVLGGGGAETEEAAFEAGWKAAAEHAGEKIGKKSDREKAWADFSGEEDEEDEDDEQ